MAGSLNKVELIGNLGNDPEFRTLPNGNGVAQLSIATSETWKDKQTGEKKEKTEWHRVVIFGKLAEIASQYLRKGSKVFIEGALQTRKWQDQAGVERYTTEIVVGMNGRLLMLSAANDNQAGGQQQFSGGGQQQRPQGGQQQSHGNNPPPQDFDDDIPF